MSKKTEIPLGTPQNIERRDFLNKAAVAGVAGTFLTLGLSACKQATPPAATGSAAAGAAGHSAHIAPGELDSYYAL